MAITENIRGIVLGVVQEYAHQENNFQAGVIFQEIHRRMKPSGADGLAGEQAALDVWHDLLRSGLLSPGFNLGNPNLPFVHLTDRGRKALENLSRDPSNPDGYMRNLKSAGLTDSIAISYVTEAVAAYNSNCFKASAVMAGCAVERLTAIVRDSLVAGMANKAMTPSSKLSDWKFKTFRDAVTNSLTARRDDMPDKLRDSFAAFWVPFTEQARLTRNDAGHPNSVDPVTADTVHGNLLLLPQNVRLVADLIDWIKQAYA